MIIWLASYPKSGNTWVRALITSLLYTPNGEFNFEVIKKISQFPLREHFTPFTKECWNLNELSKYWIIAQERLNLDNKIKFLKTHHAMCKYNNQTFSNKENTLATIYIVRDPRNILTSLSYHYSKSIDEAKNFLLDPTHVIGSDKNTTKNNDIAALIGSWSNNLNSWKKYNPSNLLLIKYEELLTDTRSKLNDIILFLKKYIEVEVSDEKIDNIIRSTTFENLKNLEKKFGFAEGVEDEITKKKKNFFHLGKANDWKKLLSPEVEGEITKKFEKEMKELNYIN